MNNQLVIINRNQAVTTSLKVADYFHKRHDHVIRDIDNLIKQISTESTTPNLGALKMYFKSSYKDAKGEQRPMYLMNRDGFSLLAMGFTGKKALQFKLSYIQAFNSMEEQLQRIKLNNQNKKWLECRNQSKLSCKSTNDSIKLLADYAKSHGSQNPDKLFLSYHKLINKTLGIHPNSRDSLSTFHLHELHKLQTMVANTITELINKGIEYHQIYQITKQILNDYSKLAMLGYPTIY